MRWEYLIVTCDAADNGWHARYVNGEQLSNWERGPAVHEFANGLGNEGWEMISYTPFATTESHFRPWLGTEKVSTSMTLQMVFKRPRG